MTRANTYDQIETMAINMRQVIDGLPHVPSLILALLVDAFPMAMRYDHIARHLFEMTSYRPSNLAINSSVKHLRIAIRTDKAALQVLRVKTFHSAGYGLEVLVETGGKPLNEVIAGLISTGIG